MKSLFSFEGRISRGKYWLSSIFFVLLPLIFVIAAGFFIFGSIFIYGFPGAAITSPIWAASSLLVIISFIIVTFIYLTTNIKRFHDRGKSGWWALIGFIPFLGFWWILIECGFLKGDTGSNEYGQDPLEAVSVGV